MILSLISMIAALSVGQQSHNTGAVEPVQTPAPTAVASAQDAAPETPSSDRNRLVCVNIPVTGSRFPLRRCRTQAQADAERLEAQEQLRRSQVSRVPTG